MEILQQKLQLLQGRFRSITMPAATATLYKQPLQLLREVRAIGYSSTMDDYEKRKLRVFNQINFFQIISGIIIPLIGLLSNEKVPATTCIIALLPVLLSVVALCLNHYHNYQAALLCYFILYPFFTCIVFMNGMNLGIGLYFILYGVLSVFFLKDIGYMLFTIAMCMMSYFVICVLLKNFRYHLEVFNKPVYLFSQALALAYIYYGLFLIKKENAGYQLSILRKNSILQKKNIEIKQQKDEIAEKAKMLKVQTKELTELNALKNKLFSVIAHDLKTPMYAFRTLFRNVQQFNVPAEEVKAMIPEVVNDLNYAIGLMENLLEWSKSQMEANNMVIATVDVNSLINDAALQLRLQAEAKQIELERPAGEPVFIKADKHMIALVLRNLISNAIKFTPVGGRIVIGTHQLTSVVEVYVQDNGTGITPEALQQIEANNYYTTNGTAKESGTGLGLMLCREFIAKNSGAMHIKSTLGKGSTFSFTLPRG